MLDEGLAEMLAERDELGEAESEEEGDGLELGDALGEGKSISGRNAKNPMLRFSCPAAVLFGAFRPYDYHAHHKPRV